MNHVLGRRVPHIVIGCEFIIKVLCYDVADEPIVVIYVDSPESWTNNCGIFDVISDPQGGAVNNATNKEFHFRRNIDVKMMIAIDIVIIEA